MIYVRIDIATDKHNYVIINSDREVLAKAFSFPNTLDGFNTLLQRISSVTDAFSAIKVGLEATATIGYNLPAFY